MTDRPIIFSGPMVRALLDGRKTQTRRLATSPLTRCAVDDRLYVREAFGRCPDCGYLNAREGINRPSNCAACDEHVGKFSPSIHMPRTASRLTLVVESVRIEPLTEISVQDAIAEGLHWHPVLRAWQAIVQDGWPTFTDPRRSYAGLWNSLHTTVGERWQDNPAVVALIFRVERGNIDFMGQHQERGIA